RTVPHPLPLLLFFLHASLHHPALHSFPTRRSSDLDPTFGGAMVNGQRNVFQALDSISPFAFAFGPRNWSPIISDFKLTPGGPYDLEQIRSEEHTSELQSRFDLVCRLLLEKKKPPKRKTISRNQSYFAIASLTSY